MPGRAAIRDFLSLATGKRLALKRRGKIAALFWNPLEIGLATAGRLPLALSIGKIRNCIAPIVARLSLAHMPID